MMVVIPKSTNWVEILNMILIFTVAFLGVVITWFQFKIKKQEWRKANWDIHVRNYEKVNEAMSLVIFSSNLPMSIEAWEDKSSISKLTVGEKENMMLDKAVDVIYQAKSEANLLLEDGIYNYVENIREKITILRDKYREYGRLIVMETADKTVIRNLKIELWNMVKILLKYDCAAHYRKYTAIQK
jgi:hypothetical protein